MTKIIAANWKQNGSLILLIKLTRDIRNGVNRLNKRPKVILFPPSIYLDSISKEIKSNYFSSDSLIFKKEIIKRKRLIKMYNKYFPGSTKLKNFDFLKFVKII